MRNRNRRWFPIELEWRSCDRCQATKSIDAKRFFFGHTEFVRHLNSPNLELFLIKTFAGLWRIQFRIFWRRNFGFFNLIDRVICSMAGRAINGCAFCDADTRRDERNVTELLDRHSWSISFFLVVVRCWFWFPFRAWIDPKTASSNLTVCVAINWMTAWSTTFFWHFMLFTSRCFGRKTFNEFYVWISRKWFHFRGDFMWVSDYEAISIVYKCADIAQRRFKL